MSNISQKSLSGRPLSGGSSPYRQAQRNLPRFVASVRTHSSAPGDVFDRAWAFYLFTALRAAFRIMINKLYSPMELTLSDYFLNPFYIIFNYINGDFKSKNGQNIAYFVLNLILSSLTAFSAFIYNEFIVLFCFGFERNTYDQITKRSFDEKVEMRIYDSINEVSKETEEEEDDEIEDKKDKFEKNDSFKIYV